MPELTEPIESINKQLERLFGVDTVTGAVMWRVVWSETQMEKRLMYTTDEGLQLLSPEVRLVPKYRQWIQERFVLERLVVVPDVNANELPTQKLSYEPMWVFETQRGIYLPPRFDACKVVVDTIYSHMGRSNLAKYKDPDSTQENALENHKVKIDKLVVDMFGNETEVGDALAYGEGVGYTGPSKIKES
jgi:hypothetical protein